MTSISNTSRLSPAEEAELKRTADVTLQSSDSFIQPLQSKENVEVVVRKEQPHEPILRTVSIHGKVLSHASYANRSAKDSIISNSSKAKDSIQKSTKIGIRVKDPNASAQSESQDGGVILVTGESLTADNEGLNSADLRNEMKSGNSKDKDRNKDRDRDRDKDRDKEDWDRDRHGHTDKETEKGHNAILLQTLEHKDARQSLVGKDYLTQEEEALQARQQPQPVPAPRPATVEQVEPLSGTKTIHIPPKERPAIDPKAMQQHANSSNISAHSTSPTVVSKASPYPGGATTTTHLQKRVSSLSTSTTTTFTTFTAAGPGQIPSHLEPAFDKDHFRTVFKELTTLTEKLQDLNDQVIEALTTYPIAESGASPRPALAWFESLADSQGDEHHGSEELLPPPPQQQPHPMPFTVASSASSTTSVASSSSSNSSDSSIPVPRYTREEKGKDRASNTLEENQFIIAQTFTNLVESSWPRIYRNPPETLRTPQMTKDRVRVASKLKNAIVTFWSVQSHYQDQAQLILDLYEDPAQFEHEDRILILKSRHLNNLLSNPEVSPVHAAYWSVKFRTEQERLSVLSERLQAVWLGILLLLGDPDQISARQLSKTHAMDVGSHHWNTGHQQHMSSSFVSSLSPLTNVTRRRCCRLSGNKRLGLKVAVLLFVGTGMISMALILNTSNSTR
ncbi:hypothetical protein BGZ94_002899 [Podila epigama]|nr:hypothetical protein BGZ94_002899 [Podila epigama]